MYETPIRCNEECKQTHANLQRNLRSYIFFRIGRLALILGSAIGSLKWKRKTSKEELTFNNAEVEVEPQNHEIDPHVSQGMVRSYTSFSVR